MSALVALSNVLVYQGRQRPLLLAQDQILVPNVRDAVSVEDAQHEHPAVSIGRRISKDIDAQTLKGGDAPCETAVTSSGPMEWAPSSMRQDARDPAQGRPNCSRACRPRSLCQAWRAASLPGCAPVVPDPLQNQEPRGRLGNKTGRLGHGRLPTGRTLRYTWKPDVRPWHWVTCCRHQPRAHPEGQRKTHLRGPQIFSHCECSYSQCASFRFPK